MVTRRQIQALADQIATRFPEVRKIILFGSHAYGAPTGDNDVDLLIVMDHRETGYRAASRIRTTVDLDLAVDFIARGPKEIADRLRQGDTFMEQITPKGAVLYEAEHGRMGREGGSGLRRSRRASPLA